ncbi:hypothetical protein PM082_012128 [Marasmius tenuissimus]|nr:hypothetical protein PM082_012128 [Marasmius tenuissimus]
MANPATPQRNNNNVRTHNTHAHSISHPYIRDPISPPSPYTPLSLRSFSSSNASPASTLATPNSVTNISPLVKRISFSTPQVARLSSHIRSSSSSIADITQNWRSRATENGIKVAGDDSYFDDGDMSFGDTSGYSLTEEVLQPQSFAAASRRRALSQSHAGVLPLIQNAPRTPARRLQPTSPTVTRKTLSSLSSNTATPPPKRNLAQQLRMKGCMTDPPQLRKREAFGVVPTASQNIPSGDVSFELFDIDENDYEYEYDYDNDPQLGLPLKGADDSMEYHYPSVGSQQLLPPTSQQPQQQSHVNFLPQNYPISNPSMLSLLGQPTFSDPYGVGTGNVLSGRIADSVEHHFNQYQQQQMAAYANHAPPGLGLPLTMGLRSTQPHAQHGYLGGQGLPSHLAQSLHPRQPSTSPMPSVGHSLPSSLCPSPLPRVENVMNLPGGLSSPAPSIPAEMNIAPSTSPEASKPPTSCVVCSRSHLTRLAILSPCGHPLCSACLTSALNIVGEKDMECASCKKEVVDFKLVTNDNASGPSAYSGAAQSQIKPAVVERGFMDPLSSSPRSTGSGLESAFEFNGYVPEFDPDDVFSLGPFGGEDVVRASTPPPKNKMTDRVKANTISKEGTPAKKAQNDLVVLRIDNVPWDITPPRIAEWLQQPVVRVHVLLDRKGKTMSHAFAEVTNEEIAGAILRGEAQQNEGSRLAGEKPKMRGSVLGHGKRARGVTVTRSSQRELMSALFPAWQGSFDGSRPSLAGLDNDRVISALESGLMTEGDAAALLYLIRSPDAHFLKVPCLPFHSLISILHKFPADVDSRVFWSGALRDVLFDVTFAAIQVLMARVESKKTDREHTPELVDNLVKAAIQCQAFTSVQTKKILQLMQDTRRQLDEPSMVSEPESVASSLSSLALSRRIVHNRSPSAQSVSSRVSSRRSSYHARSKSQLGQSTNTSPTTSASASFASESAQADDEDEGDEAYERSLLRSSIPSTPSSGTAASHRSSPAPAIPLADNSVLSRSDTSMTTACSQQSPSVGDLAKEFGVEAHLVEALLQRLGRR